MSPAPETPSASDAQSIAPAISVPIHPNATSNLALIVGTLEIDGRCLFLTGSSGGRFGVAWPAGTKWEASRRTLVVGRSVVSPGQEVAITGGSADVTRESMARTPWLVRPLPECLGDGFIFAGAVSPVQASPST